MRRERKKCTREHYQGCDQKGLRGNCVAAIRRILGGTIKDVIRKILGGTEMLTDISPCRERTPIYTGTAVVRIFWRKSSILFQIHFKLDFVLEKLTSSTLLHRITPTHWAAHVYRIMHILRTIQQVWILWVKLENLKALVLGSCLTFTCLQIGDYFVPHDEPIEIHIAESVEAQNSRTWNSHTQIMNQNFIFNYYNMYEYYSQTKNNQVLECVFCC